MTRISMLLVALMAAAVVVFAWHRLRPRELGPMSWPRRLRTIAATVLLLAGAAGFFGNALSAMGAWPNLPAGFQWPAGYARHVVTTPSGLRLVAHVSSRLQVYDGQWRFLRGWYVPASGGVFYVSAVHPDDTLEIIAVRSQQRYVYDIHGRLLSSDRYAQKPPRAPGAPAWVPTWPWLIGFSHPAAGWVLIVASLLLYGWGQHRPPPTDPAATVTQG